MSNGRIEGSVKTRKVGIPGRQGKDSLIQDTVLPRFWSELMKREHTPANVHCATHPCSGAATVIDAPLITSPLVTISNPHLPAHPQPVDLYR